MSLRKKSASKKVSRKVRPYSATIMAFRSLRAENSMVSAPRCPTPSPSIKFPSSKQPRKTRPTYAMWSRRLFGTNLHTTLGWTSTRYGIARGKGQSNERGILLRMAKLSETLTERGYVYQLSSQKLSEITEKQRTIYLGIDPSADSLQIGQLMAFLILRRFIEDKHKVVILMGGGTGMIGDPGGKSAERPLLDTDTVRRNSEAIAEQVKRLLGGADFMLLDNAEWLGNLNPIEFLRDVGKHFTVNTMLQRDFIKERIKNPGEGISYTEFSYALLLAYDLLHLHREYEGDG